MTGIAVLPFDELLTPGACRILDVAFREAKVRNEDLLETHYFLLGFLYAAEGIVADALADAGVELDWVLERQEYLGWTEKSKKRHPELSALSVKLLGTAFRLRELHNDPQVTVEHLFFAFLQLNRGQGHHVLMSRRGVDPEEILKRLKERISRIPEQGHRPPD